MQSNEKRFTVFIMAVRSGIVAIASYTCAMLCCALHRNCHSEILPEEKKNVADFNDQIKTATKMFILYETYWCYGRERKSKILKKSLSIVCVRWEQ